MPELLLEQPLRTVTEIPDDNLSLDDDEAKDAKVEMLMDQLYADAKKADKELGRFIDMVISGFPGGSVAIKRATLKLRSTAKAKLSRAGGRRSKDLKDISRATLEFYDMETMYAARDYIVRQRAFTRLGYWALKNRYSSNVARGGVGPTEQGYRDIKFFLAMDIRGPRRYHIVELQLNVVHTVMAKKRSHPFYDILRLAPANWTPTRTGAKIKIPANVVEKIGQKVIHATLELERRGIEVESARTVRDMIEEKFFRKIYVRTANGKRVFDRYELKTRQAVTLTFEGPRGHKRGQALMVCSSAAYVYYKKVGREAKATGRRASTIWNKSWT